MPFSARQTGNCALLSANKLEVIMSHFWKLAGSCCQETHHYVDWTVTIDQGSSRLDLFLHVHLTKPLAMDSYGTRTCHLQMAYPLVTGMLPPVVPPILSNVAFQFMIITSASAMFDAPIMLFTYIPNLLCVSHLLTSSRYSQFHYLHQYPFSIGELKVGLISHLFFHLFSTF